jgi:hypothetical protein
MKRYTVAMVRERLADALDEAERGVPVCIERRGVRYRLEVERTKPRRKTQRALLTVLDKSLEDGQWTWDLTTRGLRFRGRTRM